MNHEYRFLSGNFENPPYGDESRGYHYDQMPKRIAGWVETLNELGKDGWEVASPVDLTGWEYGSSAEARTNSGVILRRPIAE